MTRMSLSPRRSILVIHMCELRRQKTSHAVRICNCFFTKMIYLKPVRDYVFFFQADIKTPMNMCVIMHIEYMRPHVFFKEIIFFTMTSLYSFMNLVTFQKSFPFIKSYLVYHQKYVIIK
jgi:hypothetical protein